MSDDTVLGAVRDSLNAAKHSLSDLHMDTPVAAVIRHGQVTRWRRRAQASPPPRSWRPARSSA